MVLLKSENFKPNFQAPDFDLPSVDGRRCQLSDFSSKQVLAVLFICNHCPYVKAIEDRLIALEREFHGQNVQLVGICANDPTHYPEDDPASLLKRWQEKNYGFPYLIDESQQTARAYGAVCTPDLFVFDASRRLAYHGRLDDNWQEPAQVTRRDLALAIQALLTGQRPSAEQIPSMGCSIKWKK